MAIEEWRKEAEEEAKKYSEAIKQSNQYLIDQLVANKNNALEQLKQQNDNAMYNLNTNKSTINSTAESDARQLDVARLLALKSNQQSMNRAGLGTQGIVGSQVNAINNNYNTNLSSVLNQKANSLRDLEKEKNAALLTYNTNRLNTENSYDSNIANLRSAIDDKALNQYNTVLNNYMAYKQQEYENQQAELARQEAIRQYNNDLAYRYAALNASNDVGFGDDSEPTTEGTTDSGRYDVIYGAINKMITDGFANKDNAEMFKDKMGAIIADDLAKGTISEAQAEYLFKLTDTFETHLMKNNNKKSTTSTSKTNKSSNVNASKMNVAEQSFPSLDPIYTISKPTF